MTSAEILELTLLALSHAQELSTLYNKAVAEKRDLTDEEVAGVRARAIAANEKLKAA